VIFFAVQAENGNRLPVAFNRPGFAPIPLAFFVSDHRVPHLAAIGPAHGQKYASPSRLPHPAAPCGRLFRGYLTFVGFYPVIGYAFLFGINRYACQRATGYSME